MVPVKGSVVGWTAKSGMHRPIPEAGGSQPLEILPPTHFLVVPKPQIILCKRYELGFYSLWVKDQETVLGTFCAFCYGECVQPLGNLKSSL